MQITSATMGPSAFEQERASAAANRSASLADAAAVMLDLGERLGDGMHALCHRGTSWKVLIDPTDQAPLRCGWPRGNPLPDPPARSILIDKMRPFG